MMNIYNLTGNFLEVQKMLEDDAENEALIGTLESIECVIEEKAQNYIYIDRNMQGHSNALDVEIKRLQAKKQAIDSKRESFINGLFKSLEVAGLTELKTNICTIKQQKNPASVEIIDKSKIPAKYHTVVPESYVPRKADIAKDLKLGIDVPGCELKQSNRWVIK